MVFNATFNNISVISWRSVLLVEETLVHGENHRSVASCKDINTVEIVYRKHDVLQMMNVPRVNSVVYSSICRICFLLPGTNICLHSIR